MIEMPQRDAAFAQISENIQRFGQHIYVVAGGAVPRFAYTVGLQPLVGSEIVFAGGSYFVNDQVVYILNEIARRVKSGLRLEDGDVHIESWGTFSLRMANQSWAQLMLLGAIDYYGVEKVQGFQVIPQGEFWTVDIPNLSNERTIDSEPIWKWMTEPWAYPVSMASIGVTNLSALRGDLITEVTRWENEEWELFAGYGPDTPKQDIRTVPLATLLASDASLEAVLALPIGEGLWRDVGGDWQVW